MSLRSEDSKGPVVVIGAGLAGLAAGLALQKAGKEYVILEAQDRPGGICRSEVAEGFTFDYTGHLLHLKDGASRDLIMDLVGKCLIKHTRKASVFVKDVFVDYPVQAHFGKLPSPYARRCLEELLERAGKEVSRDLFFDEWAKEQFGPTLAGLFMIPYNAKLNVHPLNEMEISWTSWSVPIPSAGELEAIACGEDPPSYGYNAAFYYPERDGIEMLPRAFAIGQEENIRTDMRVTSVHADKKKVILADGGALGYSSLISTLPLHDLLRMAEGLSRGLAEAAGRLRFSSVLGVCIGLDGPLNTADHWIYFPDETLPFYRIGFPTNFSDKVAPPGCGSLYAETSWSGEAAPDTRKIAESVMKILSGTGLIDPGTGIEARIDLTIPCAYVFHDLYRARNLYSILGSLKRSGICSVGRYGAWEYSAMQDAVQWGIDTVRELLE